MILVTCTELVLTVTVEFFALVCCIAVTTVNVVPRAAEAIAVEVPVGDKGNELLDLTEVEGTVLAGMLGEDTLLVTASDDMLGVTLVLAADGALLEDGLAMRIAELSAIELVTMIGAVVY
ncbi:hypothetical protein HDU89_001061 [Geranomyces variabilis]|nr:hypothetical protein HDU89_001061 [Geranomyces variabilis]